MRKVFVFCGIAIFSIMGWVLIYQTIIVPGKIVRYLPCDEDDMFMCEPVLLLMGGLVDLITPQYTDIEPRFAGHPVRLVYPWAEIRLGHEGVADLKFVIDQAGNVSQVTISKSSGYSLLDDEAVTTIKKAKASQEYLSQRSCPCDSALRVSFKLE